MPIIVRYIGPDAAILAGTYILTGETRQVTRAQLAEAEAAHPGAFEIVDGERPAGLVSLNEPAPALPSLNEPAPPVLPSLNEPAPPAPAVAHPPVVRRGRR